MPALAKRRATPLSDGVGSTKQPLRVIELITLLVIAGLVFAVVLPRCQTADTNRRAAPASHSAITQPVPNQPPPASTPPAP